MPWTGCGQVRNLDPGKRYQAMLLNLGDGEHNMLSIAEKTGCNFNFLLQIRNELVGTALL